MVPSLIFILFSIYSFIWLFIILFLQIPVLFCCRTWRWKLHGVLKPQHLISPLDEVTFCVAFPCVYFILAFIFLFFLLSGKRGVAGLVFLCTGPGEY
jgi:hypothetical protein